MSICLTTRMRDAHFIKGPKEYVGDLELREITAKVRAVWPDAFGQGACGGWTWWAINPTKEDVYGTVMVAEAWLHRTLPGWWLRIKRKES